jgi:hypothetical protein
MRCSERRRAIAVAIVAPRGAKTLNVSDSTVRKYRPKRRRLTSTWKTFLQNHAAAIAAMDFFVVPTVTFRTLYVLVSKSHPTSNCAGSCPTMSGFLAHTEDLGDTRTFEGLKT